MSRVSLCETRNFLGMRQMKVCAVIGVHVNFIFSSSKIDARATNDSSVTRYLIPHFSIILFFELTN